MWTEEYATSLTFMVGPKYIGRFLTSESKYMLLDRVGALRAPRGRNSWWQFSIPRESPLTFKENSVRLQADIVGTIEGQGDDIKEVRTLLRIWSSSATLCYRARVDSEQVRSKFDEMGKRVMARFHFEPRATNCAMPEPIHHLQVGGVAPEYENCWFPKQLDIPRFHFPPMDIVLLCELVLVNLFPGNSRNLRQTPEWKMLVMKSQNVFQAIYFDKLHDCVNNTTNTILGNLIS